MKNFSLRHLAFALLLAFSFSLGLAQDRPKAERKSVGEETITVVKDRSGAIMQLTRSIASDLDEDLSLEPKTDIRLKIEILEIKPSETKAISKPEGRVPNGESFEISMGSAKTPSFYLSITPSVVENKGVELKIKCKIEPEMKEPLTRTILVENSQRAVIDLFENKSADSKLAVSITPLIEIKAVAREYPGTVNELQFVKSFLTINEDELVARGGLSVKNATEDVFPYIFVQGKGIYILSFKPFDGAEPKGIVKGDILKIKIGEDEFDWLSQGPILPMEGPWIVWVRHNPHFQSTGFAKEFLYLETKNGFVGIGLDKDYWKRFFIATAK
jgi:hypothetical protein